MLNTSTLLPAHEGLNSAVAAIRSGRLVVMPTDTVYGIAARPDLPAAVQALFAAKQRPRHQPMPVLVASAEQAEPLAQFNELARTLMATFWPGALTLVAPMRPELVWDLGQTDGTVALRQPAHPTALDLLELTGPLAVTSANHSGQAPSLEAWAARKEFGAQVAVYLDDGPSPGEIPSTVVRLDNGEVKVLREGAIAQLEVVQACRRAEASL